MRDVILGSFLGFVLAAALLAACGGGGIGGTDASLDELTARVTDLEGALAQIQADMVTMQDDHAALAQELAGTGTMQDDPDSLSQELADVQSRLSDLTKDVVGINSYEYVKHVSATASDIDLPAGVYYDSPPSPTTTLYEVTFTPPSDTGSKLLNIIAAGTVENGTPGGTCQIKFRVTQGTYYKDTWYAYSLATGDDEDFVRSFSFRSSGSVGEQYVQSPLTLTVWVSSSKANLDAVLADLTFTAWTTTEKLTTVRPSSAFKVK